jgi:hypothetical protein
MHSDFRQWLPTLSAKLPSYWLVGTVFALALALRLPFWMDVRHPGHADPAYYVALASNLAAGRGFVIDYVWHFLIPDVNLTHYANDYWMPGPSLVMSVPMLLVGPTAAAAVVSCMVLSAATAALATFVAGRRIGQAGGAIAGLVLAALPQSVAWSLQADSVTIAATAILGAYAIALEHRGSRAPVYAGIALGLALCCRQDALLAVGPVASLLLAKRETESWWRRALGVAAGAALPLAILGTMNLVSGGYLLPRSGRALLAVDYEDIFRIGGPDLSEFFRLPMGERLGRLGAAAWTHCTGWSAETRHWGWPGLVLVALMARRDRLCAATLLHFGSVLAFYSLFAPVGLSGGFARASASVVPVVVLSASGVLPRLGAFGPWLASVAILWLALAATNRGRSIVERNNRIGDEAGAVAALIPKNDASRAVVMTRSPWQLALHGVRAVQIPNDSEESIIATACRYHVNYFVLPSPSVRPALEDLVRRRSWSVVGSAGGAVVYSPCSSSARCEGPSECAPRAPRD